MLTPRTTLARRVTAALDASPSRIPVLLGGCGSGRTTLLRQLRDRIGRTSVQHIDVERTATTPERFLRAVTAVAPFPVADAAPASANARAAFDATLAFLGRARTPAGDPATFFLDEFLELRTFESFPGLRRVLHDCLDGLAASGNRFVLTSRYVARALRLLRDRTSRFEVIDMPALSIEDTLDILGPLTAAAGPPSDAPQDPQEADYLALTEISQRLQRTPGSTKDYLSWLEDVDLVAARQKRYSFSDPMLRVWVRLHCRPSAPNDDDLAREVHRYALPRLPQPPEAPPARKEEPAFAMAGGPPSGIIEID